VRAIPAGAFVKVPGMHNLDPDVDPDDEPRTYRAAPFHSRLAMASAGTLMHFAIALLCFFIAFTFFGRVTPSDTWAIRGGANAPQAGTPAGDAGLQAGDRIVSIDGIVFNDFDATAAYWKDRPGQTLNFVIDRNGQQVQKAVAITETTNPCRTGGFLGVAPEWADVVKRDAPHVAAGQSVVAFGTTVGQSVQGFGKIFSPSGVKSYGKSLTTDCQSNERLVSPIGFAKIGSQVAKSGWGNSLLFFAGVNIFIGMFNWFPLLPFDGGHMAIAVYEKIRGGKRNPKFRADIAKLLPFSYGLMIIMAMLTVGNVFLDLKFTG
jgi:RIP metalloprotease RseP